MAGTKEFFFKPDALLRLLTHYTDGEVPMNGEVTDFLVNEHLGRAIGLLVLSHEWQTPEPLHIRYDGKRIASWTQDSSNEGYSFEQREETPSRQN